MPSPTAEPTADATAVATRRWRAVTPTVVLARTGDPITALAVSGAGRRAVIVAGTATGEVLVWDERAIPLGAARRHAGPVVALAVAPTPGPAPGPVVSLGTDGWVLAGAADAVISSAVGHHADGSAVACGVADGRTVAVSAGADGTVRVWDVAGRRLLRVLEGHEGDVTAVAVAQLTGRPVVLSAGPEDGLRIWNMATGVLVAGPLHGLFEVRAVACRDWGHRALAVAADEDELLVYDVDTLLPTARTDLAVLGDIRVVDLDAVRGRPAVVAVGAGGAVLVDAVTGQPVGSPVRLGSGVVAARVVGGRAVAVGWDPGSGELRLGRPDEVAVVPRLPGDSLGVYALALARLDDRYVALYGGLDKKIHRHDTGTGEPIGAPVPVSGWLHALAVTDLDGRPVVVSGSGHTVRAWDLAGGEPVGPAVRVHWRAVKTVACLPGRSVVVSAGNDARIRAVDLLTGAAVGVPLRFRWNLVNRVQVVAWQGRTVVVAAAGWSVLGWDLDTGEQMFGPLRGQDGPVEDVAVAEVQGRLCAVLAEGRAVRLRDLETGHEIAASLPAHDRTVRRLCLVHAAGRLVVFSGGEDHRVYGWDLRSGARVFADRARHAGAVNTVAALAVDRDRILLASASAAGRDSLRLEVLARDPAPDRARRLR